MTDGAGDDPRFDHDAVFDPELYLHFYGDRVGPERSRTEAAFVADALSLEAGDRVLDVPCGHGRIANRLADSYEVVGVDRSRPFLARARADARERGVTDRVAYCRGDMRRLPLADAFDAAYNLFTSFGYFDDAGNRRVLAEFARLLRPGGRLLVDVVNHDGQQRDFRRSGVVERDGDYLVDRRSYDARTARVRTDRTAVVDGEVREATYTVRSYTYPELETRLEDAGFDVIADYGDTEGDEFSADSPRLVLVGQRR